MFKLHVYSQTGDLDLEVEIAGDTAIIGRSSDCDVVIDRKDISRQHARLMHGWVVDDLDSRNGTHVDGEKIEAAAALASRCFELGDPTSENMVTIEVVSSDRPPARALDESDPQVTETGLEAPRPEGARTTRPLPSDSDGSGVATLRAEFEAETERYRYKCAKLEVELEALRRSFESFQKGSGDRRAPAAKPDDSKQAKPRDDRPRRDEGGR